MSFDELPTDSPSSRPAAENEAEREASDAPLAPPARRRRTKAAGTAAASTSASTTDQPKRSPRSRRKAAPATDEPLPPAAEAVTPAKPTEDAASAPPAKPTRRSRSKKTTEAAEAPPASPAPVEPTTPVEANPPEARPARRPRQRKQTVVAEAQPDTPVIPPSETVSESPPSAAETPTPKRPSRRRTTRKADVSPSEAATTVEAVPPPVAPEEAPPTTPEEAEKPARPSRRRSARAHRRVTEETETTTPSPVPAETEPATEEPETGETPAGRTRRRRGGRGRRGESKVARTQDTAGAVAEELPTLPAEPEEVIDRSVGTHLVLRNGSPEIHINGTAVPPVLFFGNVEGEPNRQRVLSEVRRAARAGVHLHSTLIELTCPISEASHALDEIDNRLRAILDADPEGYIMPRIIFVPARGWKREYPNDIATYADGTSGDPSLTSERFWQEAERSLTTLIAHLREYEWGRRIFGYHLEQGEWFQPASQGYDRSIVNRDAFRDWLREKYKHSLIGLRAAWYDGDAQFHTAEIPPILTKPNAQRAFYESRRERRYIDFNEFTSESTAKRILALARAVKKAANHQALVSVCYGYTFEFGHPSSGHLALGLLEESPYIDLLCGPPSYRDRKPTGAASYPAPVDSPPLHGKLWLSEDDTKTYLAPVQQDPEDFNPRLGDRFATEQAQARAMGKALAHGAAIGWMDLWGEGWLDDDGIWERLRAFTRRYAAFQEQREHPRVPEVIAIIDEKSLMHVQRGEAFFRKLTNGAREALQRAGVSCGTYLQSDLLSPNFPLDAKLYLFLTPYRLNTEQRAAIKEKLQKGGKTLAWLYAPGSCEERPSVGGAMEETATSAVGLTLRQQAWNSEIGSRVIEPDHVITARLGSREIGTRERLNPSFYVADPEATVLAEYQGSGLPSLAVRDFKTWRSVFVGEPTLPLELLRGLCRYAGVHVWTPQGEDVVSVGNGWVTVHATRDGQRTLYLPEPSGLYDVTEGRLIADEALEYRYFLRAGMTRAFGVGSTARFVRLGLPNITLPGVDRERIVLEAGQSTPREASPLPAPQRSDLETLEAVLSVDVSQLDDLEIDDLNVEQFLTMRVAQPALESDSKPEAEEEAGGEVVASGRRRRRRGGRGRGRRRAGEGNGTETEGEEGEGEASSPDSVPPAYDEPTHGE